MNWGLLDGLMGTLYFFYILSILSSLSTSTRLQHLQPRSR